MLKFLGGSRGFVFASSIEMLGNQAPHLLGTEISLAPTKDHFAV